MREIDVYSVPNIVVSIFDIFHMLVLHMLLLHVHTLYIIVPFVTIFMLTLFEWMTVTVICFPYVMFSR